MNRQALLDAGARVFSRSGFQAANVREICREAGLNIGAIHQHFGSKDGLYREVILGAGRSLVAQEPCARLEDFETPEQALRGWMQYHLTLVLLRRAADPVAGPLLMREFRNPTRAFASFVEFVIKPVRAELLRIVGALLGSSDTPARRAAAANLVYGLGVFQGVAAPVLELLGQRPPARQQDVTKLLDVLYPFALGGIRALRTAQR
ncbi:MAG: TetR/AcrR family transcriptional regulator [Planctomycetes bacterium]|nr:TetR/AcrR family transcriptional regulator [Planctomycetota bacterium]